jgi:hypothetical protein
MIAYRAETAMANSLREHLTRPDEARRLLWALYTNEADLLPDPGAGTLTVRLHHSANSATDQAIEKLCEELNATETVFPRTNLRLVLKLGIRHPGPVHQPANEGGGPGLPTVPTVEMGPAHVSRLTLIRNSPPLSVDTAPAVNG